MTFPDTLTTQELSLWCFNIVGGEILTCSQTLSLLRGYPYGVSRFNIVGGEILTFPDSRHSHYSGVIPMVFQHSGKASGRQACDRPTRSPQPTPCRVSAQYDAVPAVRSPVVASNTPQAIRLSKRCSKGGSIAAHVVSIPIKSEHARHVARRVGASPPRHLREYRTRDRQILATHAIVTDEGGRRRAIRGHQRPLEVIRGHQRPSEAIRGHAWAIRGIRGHQRPSEAAVPFDVAPRDWLGDPAVGQRVVVTEHLARVIRAIRAIRVIRAIRAIRAIRVIRVNSGKFG